MFKKMFTLLIFSIMIIFTSQIFPTQATASENPSSSENGINAVRYFGPFSFTTNDGLWDGQFSVPSTGDVTVTLSGSEVAWEWGLSVQLCSAGSGRCTGFGPLSVSSNPSRTFTDVLPGSYYVDVRFGATISGTSRIEVRY
ncbi:MULTISPECIES: hypothetical protein [unclassified Oceanobacillus]|uniref:hypothetical protein n=1 Tax=unclassified Oceanobacillus TaxID=2630292 RepID=UPI001BE50338|nr:MULTISPECIES: hypothetical protein [unclassified Oceanobacillus]MBT2599074.1 hypothetical protein [Oceanobacillus sp. ISL-74]MBT2651992.1 hypothetical protein [Oceanobacillus sp. ISL-73]